MGDFLQVSKVALEECTTDGKKVGVAGIVHFHDAPGILSGADLLSVHLDNILGADNGKRHEASQFRILLHSVFIVLLNIVRKVVDGNAVVLNIFHNQLLRLGEFGGCEGVCFANDRDDVDTGRETLHQLNVEFAKAAVISQRPKNWFGAFYLPMARRCDEVQQNVDAVIAEARITLDARLLGKNVIILPLEVANNFREAVHDQNVLNAFGGL